MKFNIGDIHNNHKILDYINGKNNNNYYYKFYVVCLKCGKLKYVHTFNFRNVSCSNGPCHINFINLSGTIKGDILFLEYLKFNGIWKWKYICNLCNTEYISRSSHFLTATQSACQKCTASKISKAKMLPNKGSEFNRAYRNYKRNALNNNLEFDLSKEEFKNLIMKNCFYCNAKPISYSGGYVRNGIDKINANIGYIKSNIVPCCITCNHAKSDMSIDEFKDWIKNVYNFYIKDK